MYQLHNWSLLIVSAQGLVFGHADPKMLDGTYTNKLSIFAAEVADGALVVRTSAGDEYLLPPDKIDPAYSKDTAASLKRCFGIDGGFVENCVRLRREADARALQKEERLAEPGGLLITTMGGKVLHALFRDADGTVAGVKLYLSIVKLRESVRFIDRDSGRVLVQCLFTGNDMEPCAISDGVKVIQVQNLGPHDLRFGRAGREVPCPPGEITAIPVTEHDCEDLPSPDAVNGGDPPWRKDEAGERNPAEPAIPVSSLYFDRLEPVDDLAETRRETLLVTANALSGKACHALAACKDRLRGEGKKPFFIRACHRRGEDAVADGLFDLTFVCGGEEGDEPPLTLPGDILVSMLNGLFPLDRGEILQPGRLSCFARTVAWEGDSGDAAGQFRQILRREAAAAKAENETLSRFLVCITVNPELGMDMFERCVSALSEGDVRPEDVVFQLEFDEAAPENTITVRGMIG